MRWALVEAIQHVPAGHPLRQRKDDILARRGDQAKHIAKIAVARQLLTWVSYAMRGGPGPRPRARHRPGRMSTHGRRQRVIAGFTGPSHRRAAAWSDRSRCSSAMGWSVYWRTLRRARMASDVSMAPSYRTPTCPARRPHTSPP